LAALACSSESERPAPYTAQGKGPENLRTCRDIQPGSLMENEVWIEGARAGCVAEGLICPLGPAFQLGGSCHAGGASAHCVGQRWVLYCIDGGAP
jgi:hypothetical protein